MRVLEQAVRSFFDQNGDGVREIHIGQDGTTCATLEIARRLECANPRTVTVITRSPNFGARAIAGDDYWADVNNLSRQVDGLGNDSFCRGRLPRYSDTSRGSRQSSGTAAMAD